MTESDLRSDRKHVERATARPDRSSNPSEEDQRSSLTETREAEEAVVVPAPASWRKRRKRVVYFVQYSRPVKRQVPLSVKAREALGGWQRRGNGGD
jgi:hypothetical protein